MVAKIDYIRKEQVTYFNSIVVRCFYTQIVEQILNSIESATCKYNYDYTDRNGIRHFFWWEKIHNWNIKGKFHEIITNGLSCLSCHTTDQSLRDLRGTIAPGSTGRIVDAMMTYVVEVDVYLTHTEMKRLKYILTIIIDDVLLPIRQRRHKMISETAYFRSEWRKRAGLPSDSLADWVAAETEVDTILNYELNPQTLECLPKLNSITKAEIQFRPGGIGYIEAETDFRDCQRTP